MSTMILPSRPGRSGGVMKPSERPRRVRRPTAAAIRSLLGLPLFTKLMVANGVIVLGTAAAVRWAGSSLTDGPLAFPLIATLGLLAILAGNAAILWLALAPLRNIQSVAARVSAGDLEARVPDTPLADREMRRLVETFNAGLAAAARQNQRLRGLQLRGTSANEAVRERVAYQLHDDVAQALTAFRLRARLALASNDSQLRDAVLREVSDGLETIVHEVRGVASNLRPLGLQLLGPGVVIEACARATLGNAGIHTTVRSDSVHGLLSRDAELALFRVAEEAFSNIVRHSQARRATVTLERGAAHVELRIQDDGIGFEPETSDGNEFGLLEMQERVAAAGGHFELSAARGQGVCVKVTIPIECDANGR